MDPIPGAGGSEEQRLRELYSLDLLDTYPGERFDRYTRLVADIFGASHCAIHLIDRDMQWPVSATGEGLRAVRREESVCASDLDKPVLEIPDIRHHESFSESTYLSEELGVRFYAGVLLRGPTGQALGRLCILDSEPRRLDEPDRGRLEAFGTLVEQEINFNHRLRQVRDELKTFLLFDFATGVPRQEEMETRLGAMVREAEAQGRVVAVAVFHYLGFEEFLATYGREAVNSVVRLFAERLREAIREGDLLARPSMDHMVAAAGGFEDIERARDWAASVYQRVIAPYPFGDGERAARVKAGVSFYPADGRDAAALVNQAVLAGDLGSGSGLRFHDPEHQAGVRRRDRLRLRLGQAIKQDVLELAFQPIHRLSDGRPVGCEALARWEDEELGRVSPGEFIPLAESEEWLARLLNRTVLRQAARAAAALNGQGAPALPVNVNIAAAEFRQADFPEEVGAALEEAGARPEWLVMEITEGTVIEDVDAAARMIDMLRGQGVRCALDDFGTGYSSLGYLRQLPFATLKIDRSFIVDIPDDPVALRLTGGIVNIGKALEMKVVAEGVETEAQRKALAGIGCDGLQGYLMSRPMALEDAIGFLRRG